MVPKIKIYTDLLKKCAHYKFRQIGAKIKLMNTSKFEGAIIVCKGVPAPLFKALIP